MKTRSLKAISLFLSVLALPGCTHVNDYISDIAFETKEAARELYREKIEGYDDNEERRMFPDETSFLEIKALSREGEMGLMLARSKKYYMDTEHWKVAADLVMTMGEHYENPDVQIVQDMEDRIVNTIDTIDREVDRTVILLALLEYQMWRNENLEKIENTLTKCHEAVENTKGFRRLEVGNKLRKLERNYRRSKER